MDDGTGIAANSDTSARNTATPKWSLERGLKGTRMYQHWGHPWEQLQLGSGHGRRPRLVVLARSSGRYYPWRRGFLTGSVGNVVPICVAHVTCLAQSCYILVIPIACLQHIKTTTSSITHVLNDSVTAPRNYHHTGVSPSAIALSCTAYTLALS